MVSDGEQLWQLTLEHSPVGMTLVAPDGRLLSANRALCQMLGYTEEQIRALSFQEITHPDDLAEDLVLLDATLAGERSSYRLRKRYFHADGHVVWGDLSVALLRAPDGTPIHFISQILDVTEPQESAARLAETSGELNHQRLRLQAVLESVDIGLVVLDRDGQSELVNRRHQQFMELARPGGAAAHAGHQDEVFAEDGLRLLSSDERPVARAARGEEFDDLRVCIGSDPLTRRALSSSARSVSGPDGEFDGAVLAYADVTDYVRAMEAKDAFVASVSHELRTPLTSILGHLELLAERPDDPAEVLRRVRVVERNATRLRDLVADLLQAAQMTDGQVQLNRLPLQVADIVVDAVEAVRPIARSSGIEIALDVPERGPVASVDGQRLRQVLDNLLSNGVKYTEPGGSVTVVLRQEGPMLDISVSDTGIGIAPADLDRLFTRFFRGHQAKQRMVPGAGLGLSIVRGIVEAHGGQVQIDSVLGEGSTFRVLLPLLD
jgi:hypothetical protein